MERLDYAGALGPTAPDARRQRNHSGFPIRQRLAAERQIFFWQSAGGINDIPRLNVLNCDFGRQTVLCQSNSSSPEIKARICSCMAQSNPFSSSNTAKLLVRHAHHAARRPDPARNVGKREFPFVSKSAQVPFSLMAKS